MAFRRWSRRDERTLLSKCRWDEPPAQGHVLDPQPVESRLPGHTWAWQPAPARWAGRGGGAGYQLRRLWRHRVRAPTPTGSLTGTKPRVRAPQDISVNLVSFSKRHLQAARLSGAPHRGDAAPDPLAEHLPAGGRPAVRAAPGRGRCRTNT